MRIANLAPLGSAPRMSVGPSPSSANKSPHKMDVPMECPKLSCPVVPQEDPCRLTLSKPVHRDLLPWQCVSTFCTCWVWCLLCSRPASCRCALEFESVPTNVAASMCTLPNSLKSTVNVIQIREQELSIMQLRLDRPPCVGPMRTTGASMHPLVLRLHPA